MAEGRPILVTGSIRSGTTWVGKTLATAPGVGLVHEPFNKDHPLGICAHRWAHQYTYLTDETPETASAAGPIEDTLSFRYRPWTHLRSYEGPLRTLGLVRDFPRAWYRRHVSRPRPLLKDPIALLSADWLADRFDMDVVLMVRHPGAFVWSYKRIAEPNRFTDLLQQPALMNGPLEPFADEIERAAATDDSTYQAAILWRLLYSTAAEHRSRHPDWIVARHEDLSTDPLGAFSGLFGLLDLQFTDRTRRFIARTTSELNPVEAPDGVLHHLRRNSRANVRVWQRRLPSEEISRVRRLTADVADRFYATSSWPSGISFDPPTPSSAPSVTVR